MFVTDNNIQTIMNKFFLVLIYLSSIFFFTHAEEFEDIKGNGHVITKVIKDFYGQTTIVQVLGRLRG